MPARDRVFLRDLGFYGYHGVFGEEARLGQRFQVDIECGVDLSSAARSDDLSGTINYADLYDTVKAAFEARRYQLIEALAQAIADAVFADFQPVEWVRITVRKPEAPIAMVTGLAGVELYRERG